MCFIFYRIIQGNIFKGFNVKTKILKSEEVSLPSGKLILINSFFIYYIIEIQ